MRTDIYIWLVIFSLSFFQFRNFRKRACWPGYTRFTKGGTDCFYGRNTSLYFHLFFLIFVFLKLRTLFQINGSGPLELQVRCTLSLTVRVWCLSFNCDFLPFVPLLIHWRSPDNLFNGEIIQVLPGFLFVFLLFPFLSFFSLLSLFLAVCRWRWRFQRIYSSPSRNGVIRWLTVWSWILFPLTENIS